jgi:hypothetical protein
MTLELCLKYLNFVVVEVERYIKDQRVTDEELLQFGIEIENFKKRVIDSNLDLEIKSRIQNITYTYTPNKIKRNRAFIFFLIFTFGIWGHIYKHKSQENKAIALETIKSQANKLLNKEYETYRENFSRIMHISNCIEIFTYSWWKCFVCPRHFCFILHLFCIGLCIVQWNTLKKHVQRRIL